MTIIHSPGVRSSKGHGGRSVKGWVGSVTTGDQTKNSDSTTEKALHYTYRSMSYIGKHCSKKVNSITKISEDTTKFIVFKTENTTYLGVTYPYNVKQIDSKRP